VVKLPGADVVVGRSLAAVFLVVAALAVEAGLDAVIQVQLQPSAIDCK